MALRDRLVPDWRDAWKWGSTRIFIALGFVPAIWDAIPDETKALLPTAWVPYIIGVVGVIGAVVRMTKSRDRAG